MLQEIDGPLSAQSGVTAAQPQPGDPWIGDDSVDLGDASGRSAVDELVDRIDMLMRSLQQTDDVAGMLPPISGLSARRRTPG